MLPGRLIELIETHADRLTKEALADIAGNPRTRSFHLVPRDELEARVFATYHNLGRWIGDGLPRQRLTRGARWRLGRCGRWRQRRGLHRQQWCAE